MEIRQVDVVSSKVEDEEVEDEEEISAEQEGDNHVGPPPPITKYDFMEPTMDAPPL
jgi:hypothetical protein